MIQRLAGNGSDGFANGSWALKVVPDSWRWKGDSNGDFLVALLRKCMAEFDSLELRIKFSWVESGAKLTLSSPSVFCFHPNYLRNKKMASATLTRTFYNLNSLGRSKPQARRSPDSRRTVGIGGRRSEFRCEAVGVAAENRKQLVTTVKNGNDSLEICRVLNGMWQTSGGWGRIDRDAAVDAMLKYADAGLSTFDMADHCKIHEFHLILY
ncbi:hypothetical protein L1887_10059 [Cichorium endivia]|nr:hypothetical protein L1887_10059 [Cichorium endivia]